jgi:hypothetical protein
MHIRTRINWYPHNKHTHTLSLSVCVSLSLYLRHHIGRGGFYQRGGRSHLPHPAQGYYQPVPEPAVYIKGLPFDVTREMVLEFFHSHNCKVKDILLHIDHNTGRTRGSGIVEFFDFDSFNIAMNLSGQVCSTRNHLRNHTRMVASPLRCKSISNTLVADSLQLAHQRPTSRGSLGS